MGLPSDAQESPGSLLAMLGQSGFVSMHRPKDVVLLGSCSVKTTLMVSGGPPRVTPSIVQGSMWYRSQHGGHPPYALCCLSSFSFLFVLYGARPHDAQNAIPRLCFRVAAYGAWETM